MQQQELIKEESERLEADKVKAKEERQKLRKEREKVYLRIIIPKCLRKMYPL